MGADPVQAWSYGMASLADLSPAVQLAITPSKYNICYAQELISKASSLVATQGSPRSPAPLSHIKHAVPVQQSAGPQAQWMTRHCSCNFSLHSQSSASQAVQPPASSAPSCVVAALDHR